MSHDSKLDVLDRGREHTEHMYRIARAIFETRRAEARFWLAIVNEARSARTTRQATIDIARAEVDLLEKQDSEAQTREGYYSRLFQATADLVVDAEACTARLKDEADAIGLGPLYGVPAR
ncbi:hypothetical protein B0H17DRAFT_1125129, partial [Mycena rosella]